jgi:hypothetical protein
MTRSNGPRAQRQDRSRRATRRATWPSVFTRIGNILRSRAGRRPVAAVLLLLCAALLTGARLSGAAAQSQRRVPLRVSPPVSLPAVARWSDLKDGTAYTVRLQERASASLATSGFLFTFTTPSGDQLVAGLPIAKLADGSLSQSGPVNPSTGALACLRGDLRLSKNGGGVEPIVYTLMSHFDQYALVAYAHLLFAPVSDKLGAAGVCGGQTGLGSEQALDMFSGCTASDCTSPVDTAGQTVTSFEASVVSSAKQHNAQSWQPVWAGTSRVITAQYDSDRFGTLIEQQTQKLGRITAITPSTTSPQIQFDAAGQAYFSVTDTVTLDKGNGNTSSITITSYYLLESGQWVFWFSMPAGS